MYDIYSKALAVLEVLERAERSILENKPVRLVSRLRREGLFMDRSVAYLMDALRPNEALRFRNAVATVESHFARLCKEDKEFIKKEGPATTGFYMAYLEDHPNILALARRMVIGERTFSNVNKELVEVASALVTSAAWISKVLIPSLDPRLRGPVEYRLSGMIYSAEQAMEGTPAPAAYIHQIQRLGQDLNRTRFA